MGNTAVEIVVSERQRGLLEKWVRNKARRALKRASFDSLEALRKRLTDFIDYFNVVRAKPF